MGAAGSSKKITDLLARVRHEVDEIMREFGVLQDAFTREQNLVREVAQERSDIRKARDKAQAEIKRLRERLDEYSERDQQLAARAVAEGVDGG